MNNTRYTDKSYIGTGGMAMVYKAYDTTLQINVAIKELAEQLCDNQEVRQMFLNEARKMARIKHHNVVHVYDVIDGDAPTIIMEYMDGGSLATQMDVGTLPATTVIQVMEDVINGMKAIHDAGMIHRDVKPENILEHNGSYKIADFGVAMSGDEETLPFVTNKYAAPEVLTDPSKIQPNSDIYSLGIMAIEMLLGSQRFEEVVKEALEEDKSILQLDAIKGSAQAFWQQWVGGTVMLPPLNTIDETVSPEFSTFLTKLTSRDQAARPQDCATLLAELEDIRRAEGMRVSANTVHDPKLKKQMKKNKANEGDAKKGWPLWMKLSTGLGILLLLAVGALLLTPTGPPRYAFDIVTTPPGASLEINGQPVDGSTPTQVMTGFGDQVLFQLEGMEPLQVELAKDMAGLTIVTGESITLEVDLTQTASIMNSQEAADYLRAHLPMANSLSVSLDNFQPTENGYSVEVKTPLNYRVTSERGGHLLALHLGSDDVLTLIYPAPRGNTPVMSEAGTLEVGGELDLMATEPLGKEWMVFLVVEEVPPAPVVRGAQPVDEWALRFPFGGQDSPGRDMVLWLTELAKNTSASSALVQVEVVYRLSDS
jgi:serine/threonine protein kinase